MTRVIQHALPLHAASDIANYAPVALTTGVRNVVPVATVNQEPIAVTGESFAQQGRAVAAYDRGSIVEGVCGASILMSAPDIGVIGATTVAGPSGTYSQPLLGPVAGASGAVKWRVGQAMQPAVPGQVFSFYVNPRQLSGLA
jgi:hypothetical protein